MILLSIELALDCFKCQNEDSTKCRKSQYVNIQHIVILRAQFTFYKPCLMTRPASGASWIEFLKEECVDSRKHYLGTKCPKHGGGPVPHGRDQGGYYPCPSTRLICCSPIRPTAPPGTIGMYPCRWRHCGRRCAGR